MTLGRGSFGASQFILRTEHVAIGLLHLFARTQMIAERFGLLKFGVRFADVVKGVDVDRASPRWDRAIWVSKRRLGERRRY